MAKSRQDNGGCSDAELLFAWQQGDTRAAGTLIARHHTSIARFFSNRLGPDTEDLVQKTFEGLLEGIDRFRGDTDFRAYLFGIARNKLLRELRDRVRDRDRFELDPSETTMAAIDPSPTAVMAAKLQHKLLLAALRQLPIDVQIMLELHYWEKMKVDDIAVVLGKNRNTVRTRMKRGRERLEVEMVRLAESPQQLETTLGGLEKWAQRLRAEVGDAAGDDDDADDDGN
jgi:RNA polymerase sigma-70 factor (ECF subfamily)